MQSSERIKVRRASSRLASAAEAVAEVAASIGGPDLSAVVFFCSSRYDLAAMEAALAANFDCPVIGCTTAGEIDAGGLTDSALVAAGIASPELAVHARLITPLSSFDIASAERLAAELKSELRLVGPDEIGRMFGFLLVDGLSLLEEQIVAPLYWQFGGMQLIGGSAGDDLAFRRTHVYCDGRFVSDAAVFALFETTLPFRVFKTDHFEPTGARLVITASDPVQRVVYQINGLPAAEAYAASLGITAAELGPQHYSAHPVMLRVGDEMYVRSISRVNPDGSLTFLAAIEDGLVLSVGAGRDIVSNLAAQLDELDAQLPSVQLILGCDCILRRLEINDKQLQEQVNRLLAARNFIGFSTYGEQFNAVHVNQTLTGVAIGA